MDAVLCNSEGRDAFKVSGCLLVVARTDVHPVLDVVHITVILASVAFTVTVRVFLVGVGYQNTVVFSVKDTIVVVVIVASISDTILKARKTIKLIRVADIRTVVNVVTNAITINVSGTVACISDQVVVNVGLRWVFYLLAVVAGIAYTVVIIIFLIRILYKNTVVYDVGDTIFIVIPVTGIPHTIAARVFLVAVPVSGTVVAVITDSVDVGIHLVKIPHGRTIVGDIQKTVVIVVVVAGISQTVFVSVLLPGVGEYGAVVIEVHIQVQVHIQDKLDGPGSRWSGEPTLSRARGRGPAVKVYVWQAAVAVTHEARLAGARGCGSHGMGGVGMAACGLMSEFAKERYS